MRDYGTRVLGVARRSNRKEDATTIPKIREALTLACEREGFELVHIAEDGGVSGKFSPFDAAKRRDLAPWLTDPELIARWDVLMFTESDRLVRKARFSDELFEWCDAHGKTVMRTDGHTIDYKDDGEWLSVSINALIDEQYRRTISRKRKATAAHLAREGKLGYGDWALPYGYRRGADDRPAVVPGEAEVLRRIAAEIISGATLTAVCAALTADGVPTRRGGTWSTTAVSKMLTRLDRPYARAGDGSPYFLPEILSADELAKVRAQLARRSFRRRPKEDSTRHDGTLLLQAAFCPEGHPLWSFTTRGNGRPEYVYYRCFTCRGPMARMDELDRLADRWVAGYLGQVPWLERQFIPGTDTGRERDDLNRRMHDIEGQVIAGTMPPASAARMLAGLQARLDSLGPDTPARMEHKPTGKTLAQLWGELGRQGRNRMLRDMGARVIVSHGSGGMRAAFDAPGLAELLRTYYAAADIDVSWTYPESRGAVTWKELLERAA